MAGLIAGALLMLLGLFSGSVLLLASLPVGQLTPAPVLWVLFPLFSVAGYLLFVVGARHQQIRGLSRVVAGLLLLLALSSAAAMVLSAASVIPPVSSSGALWYVLAVAGLLGVVGAGANAPSDVQA